jgi:hypothetical protein
MHYRPGDIFKARQFLSERRERGRRRFGFSQSVWVFCPKIVESGGTYIFEVRHQRLFIFVKSPDDNRQSRRF